MSDKRMGVTRRDLLHSVGAVGGASLTYRAMEVLGLVRGSVGTKAPALEPGSGAGQHVIILGAGIAGLSAAYELGNAGYQVTILEATERAGGRNRTVRCGDVLEELDSQQVCRFDRAEHLYVNIGPARIPHHHQHLLGYCRAFGVELEVFSNDNRNALFHDVATDRRISGRQMYTDTRGAIAELLAKAVNRGALDQELSGLDKQAVLDLLTGYGDLQGQQREYVGSARAGFADRINAGLDDPAQLQLKPILPLKDLLGADLLHGSYTRFTDGDVNQNPTMFQPVGGMEQIIEAFKARVGKLIRYGAVVTRIESTGNGVQICFRDARTGQALALTGDFAICTIPATVLRGIDSNFAPDVRREIADMVYQRAVKIAFQAGRRFWEEDHKIYGGISWTSQDITQIWYPATGYHRRKGIILAAYTWDNTWDEAGTKPATNPFFEKMTPDERLTTGMTQLDQVHPGAGGELEVGLSRAWGKVPFQLGSWADDTWRIQPHATLSKPDGSVFFAGEHVSFLPGWQEGAILAAHAAVQGIAERVVARRSRGSAASRQ